MLLHQRAHHAAVTTSKYVISGKITFAQSKLNLPGHNLPARGKKMH